MNRKQLILIFLALIVLGGASLVLHNRSQQTWSEPQGKMGQKLFPDFQVNNIAGLHIKGQGELNLITKDGIWRVRERNDYPANYSQIRDLLLKLADLKISQAEPIGPSQLAHMELEPPGQGAGSGTLMEMKDASGKIVQSLLLGKRHIEQSATPSPYGGDMPDGRYVLRTDDSKDLLLISDPLSSVDPNAEPWLDRDFFKVEKPKTISVVFINATNSWALTRESETAPWVLTDAKAGETLDSNKVSSLASALSYASFVDVASNTSPAQTGLDKPTAITISTFDHFNYDLKIGAKTPQDNYYFTVSVTADFPNVRPAGKDEKPEDKAKLDKDFAANTKTLQDKLAQEKALGQWVYLVNTGLLEPILRERGQLYVEKKEEKPAEPAAAGEGAIAAPATDPAPLDPSK